MCVCVCVCVPAYVHVCACVYHQPYFPVRIFLKAHRRRSRRLPAEGRKLCFFL